jgi:HD-GYP domain-containing protein (c-di-GMP phosphodiesterase class II)
MVSVLKPSGVTEQDIPSPYIFSQQLTAGLGDDLPEIRMDELIEVILTVLDARDPYTFSHSLRVTEIAVLIATDMKLPAEKIRTIHEAAYMHDIGKVGIPDRVLNKMGRLTRDEMLYMQAHPRIGYNVLSRLPLFKGIAEIVLCHHERWDGLGYPAGLKGEEIPLESRIIAVADAFDAITSDRPYRKGQTMAFGIEEIQRHREDQFGPRVVDHFLNICKQIPEAIDTLADASCPNAFNGHDDLMHSRRLL